MRMSKCVTSIQNIICHAIYKCLTGKLRMSRATFNWCNWLTRDSDLFLWVDKGESFKTFSPEPAIDIWVKYKIQRLAASFHRSLKTKNSEKYSHTEFAVTEAAM